MAKKTNIEINGNKYYRVTRTIGKKSDGTPIRKTFYGSGINEANEKADAYMNDINNGLVNNYEYAILSDLMSVWLFDFLHQSSKIKPSTFQRYEGIYRKYIKNSNIAGLKLKDCNIIKIQNFFNTLSKDYSYSQLRYLCDVMRNFFNWCIDSGYMLKNPCIKIELKGNKSEIITKKKQNIIEILNEDEINIIRKHISNTDFELLFLLDLSTGLREGELLALEWKNIDLENKTLKVEKSVKEVYIYDSKDERHIETITQIPKTLTSFRTIPIPDAIIDKLKSIENKKDLLFHDEFSKHLKAKNVSYRWRKILKECNIPHKKFHCIRHTYASTLLKNGVDIQTVAELMGHSAIAITQIYLHSSNEQKYNAVSKINYLFQN